MAKLGLSLAAAAAAAAGAFYLYGANGAKHRRQFKKGLSRAQKEIMNQMARGYKKLREIDERDLGELVSQLRGYWKQIAATSR